MLVTQYSFPLKPSELLRVMLQGTFLDRLTSSTPCFHKRTQWPLQRGEPAHTHILAPMHMYMFPHIL